MALRARARHELAKRVFQKLKMDPVGSKLPVNSKSRSMCVGESSKAMV